MELTIALTLLVVGLILEKKYRIHLYHSIPERVLTTLICFIVIVSWEFINFKIYKAWLYPGQGMIGVNIFGLPFELYLFYLTGPYFSFIIYELIHRKVDKN